MIIYKATYGGKDVKSILDEQIKDGSLNVKVSNDLFGDPMFGIFKYLEIETSVGSKKVPEGLFLSLSDVDKVVSKIGIVILATNAYFVLGVRFMKKFIRHYKGDSKIKFYFFSDTDPHPYLPDYIDVEYHHTVHTSWVEGTNSKFVNMLSLKDCESDYLYYFDADTNISKDFTEEWFIGDLVGGEHYGNRSHMIENKNKPFERNPISKACVPVDSELAHVYCYGAFFGGTKQNIINMCRVLRENQLADQSINFEPCWNDESYINHYFHFNPPKIILSRDFIFSVSDKGSIGETRNCQLDVNHLKREMLEYKDSPFNITNNKITPC
jgi:hypothetical protein